MDEKYKEKLAADMNESEHVRPSVALVPLIKLEGNKGVFERRDVNEAGGYEKAREIGQTFSGVIVVIRMGLLAFEKKYSLNTPEYNSSNDKVLLFRREGKGAQGKKIDEGCPDELKERHIELRETRAIYMLVNGEVIKFQLKGSGFKHWFKLLKDLSKKKLHTFQVQVKLDPAAETNEDLNKDYYAPVFTIEKELEDAFIEKEVGPRIEVLKEQFKMMTTYRGSKATEKEPGAGVDEPAPDDLPVIDVDDDGSSGLD